jgi:hypothetical protein
MTSNEIARTSPKTDFEREFNTCSKVFLRVMNLVDDPSEM